MKFLVDAQLPRRLALLLREAGHDARHTLELESLLIPLLPVIVQSFQISNFLEVNRSVLIVHD